jgi:HEAT repeat protein
MTTLPRTFLALACLLGSLAPAPASAANLRPQDPTPGNQTPHVDCIVCGERSYTFPSGAPTDKDGNLVVWCAHCKRDTSHTSSTNTSPGLPASQPKQSTSPGGLRLRRPEAKPAAKPEAPEKPGSSTAPPAPQAAPEKGDTRISPAAAFVFQEVRKLKGLEDRLIAPSVESLCAMGEAGLVAARAELFSMEAPVLLVAARVLLKSPTPADIELVQKRLREKLPPAGGGPLLAALVAADPVHAGPRFLVEMLDSSNGGLRTQAARELRPQLPQATVAVLLPALDSKRTETRLEAIALAGSLPDPEVTDLLLARLPDPSPRVAAQVISELAGRRDERLDAKLLAQAFPERWILRSEAYALLAILEREDSGSRGILDDTQIEPLLAALEANDPFVSGACAAALAGIGFRSVKIREAKWLDQDVMDRLVGVVSGKVFHNDFSVLQSPTLRRLQLLTGQDAVLDGTRWVEWWVAARPSFHALRAWIPYEEPELAQLALRISDGTSQWRLLGPSKVWPVDLQPREDAYILSMAQAQDLARLLQTEGVFSPERLPGTRGTRGSGERLLDVTVSGRGKTFVIGADVQEPWAERILAAGRALAETNRWELYPTPGKHASVRELWSEQSAWWSAEHTQLERDKKLKELVLATLMVRNAPMRVRAFAEFQRLYTQPGLVDPADFRLFLDALSGDAPPMAVPSLIRMAIASARSLSPQSAQIPVEPARELVRAVLVRPDAVESALPDVLQAAGPDFTREMLKDPRPAVRAAAARVLARFPETDPAPALLALLSDKVTEVQAACVESLGELKAESARTELLVRARLGVKPVRAAALRAIGKLRGDYVLDALLLALSEGDPELRQAAVDGMVELADPGSAPFLVSLLSDVSAPALHEAARAGLLALRERAWPELRRALVGATPVGKLEAALVLSAQCAPEAAPVLLGALTVNPRDTRIANELVILTCIDFRTQEDPANQWWNWWDGVVHDDSLSWFRAALERAQLQPASAELLAGKGTPEGRAYLLGLLPRPENWIAERARRELSRMLGVELESLPPLGPAREAYVARVALELEKRRDP